MMYNNCELCGGRSGGVPGNDNIVDGLVVCDYCHASMLREEEYLTKGTVMIRPYTLDEAVELIGHAPSYRKVKHEADPYWSHLHGLVICDGHLFARVYDPIEDVHESISIDILAEEWVWDNHGGPIGVVA